MVGADKFGNVCALRIPQDMSRIVEEDPTGGKAAAFNGKLNSAPHKLDPIVNFHVGDLIMSLQLCTLQQGGQEVCYASSCSACVFCNLCVLDTAHPVAANECLGFTGLWLLKGSRMRHIMLPNQHCRSCEALVLLCAHN
jgi:hypothetical protein